jgi:hypothetical protein
MISSPPATNAIIRMIVTLIAPMTLVIYFLFNALHVQMNMKAAVLWSAGILKICQKKLEKKNEKCAFLMEHTFQKANPECLSKFRIWILDFGSERFLIGDCRFGN